ncbi:unnamed protein product [Ectocarpus sp. CCAP 1310/34]|nr:unnamed protein product [Ectocarpus sp. CCAP 1310/34]
MRARAPQAGGADGGRGGYRMGRARERGVGHGRGDGAGAGVGGVWSSRYSTGWRG